ncbi:MAG: hypothetical protein JXQ71_10075 [Verrucomicrobia bacterium]|nr:hypothetical protein [Verrucomicrobiota bacterium]
MALHGARKRPDHLQAVYKGTQKAEAELLFERRVIKAAMKNTRRAFAAGPGLQIAAAARDLARALVAKLAERDGDTPKSFGVTFRPSSTLTAVRGASEHLAQAVREGATRFELVWTVIPPEELKAARTEAAP